MVCAKNVVPFSLELFTVDSKEELPFTSNSKKAGLPEKADIVPSASTVTVPSVPKSAK